MSNAEGRKKRDWRRHLRGWQAGALVVWLAVLGTSLALPRATPAFVVPMPSRSEKEVKRADDLERARAEKARAEGLSHATRSVGEAVRRLGLATLTEPSRVERQQRDLARDVKKLIASGGVESLLALRALQSELFLEAVHRWLATGEVDDELRELGGDFVEGANRWRRGRDPNAPLALGDAELRLLFRVRWGHLTGTHRVHPFGPSLNEFRHYYGTLLAHPAGETPYEQSAGRLAVVGALSRIDSSYPASFARGVLLLEQGDFPAAAQELEEFARARGDGPWVLLARNHWLYAKAHLD